MTLEGTNFEVLFYVVPQLRKPVILGRDWLDREEAVIDIRRRCIHVGATYRLTAYFNEAQPDVDVKIPHLQNNFPRELQAAFTQLTVTFGSLFAEGDSIATTKSCSHRIRLTVDQPHKLPPYRYSEVKKKALNEEVERMLASQVIEPATSRYISPVVMIPKGDRFRICVDYRRLNRITVDEQAPLPLIHDTLRDLGQATVFSTIDLRNGYWQIPMEPESKPFTAFATPDGATYQFRVMPFGLKNAPATFQRFMAQEVLVGFLRRFVMVYLDDIVIYSQNHQEHLRHLHLVFERLKIHGLRCAPDKCRFATDQIEYLGYSVTAQGNQPQQKHLQEIAQYPAPLNKKQLSQFLGTANWLREYVPRYAQLSHALTDLLQKNKKWKWTDAEQAAFDGLKAAIAKPLWLSRPDPQLPFVLQTDASQLGMAAVLYQTKQNDERAIISYASQKFTPTETRYHVNEQECLAVIWAVRRYRPYLEGRRFLLRTDSQALTWLHRTKDQNAKLTRWALLLQEFSFDVEHCPGAQNELPDLLSRSPNEMDDPCAVEDAIDRPLNPIMQANKARDGPILCPVDDEIHTVAEEVRQAQRHDEGIQRIIVRLQDPLDDYDADAVVEDGILYNTSAQRRRIFVPRALVERVIYDHHDKDIAGHPGAEETRRAVEQLFYWPHLGRDVDAYVRSCLLCAQYKRRPRHPRAPQVPRCPQRAWEAVAVDLMGPYNRSRTGNRFILVATDLFTRWVEAFAMDSATTNAVARKLEDEVFSRYGYPRTLISDNGTQFVSAAWYRYCRRWEVEHWTTANYHPRANPAERRNQELKKGLRLRLANRAEDQWDELLPVTLYSLRRRRNAATGKSPSEMLYGHNIAIPGGWDIADRPPRGDPAAIQEEARGAQREYVRRRRAPPGQPLIDFQPGDAVLVRFRRRRGRNFEPLWAGPFRILRQNGQTTYTIDMEGREVVYHVDQLRAAP